jgi:hypothetical protein
MAIFVFQRLCLQFALNILYFPLWWYTKGAKKAVIFCKNLVKRGNKRLVPALWLKNIFVPMFGQYDWQGKIVSFFMRLANVIGRTIALLVWILFVVLIFLFYLFLPMVIGYMFIFTLFSI